MSHKVKLKMLVAGKWSDHPRDPIMDLVAGEICEMSVENAKLAMRSKKAVQYNGDAEVGEIVALDAGEMAAVMLSGAPMPEVSKVPEPEPEKSKPGSKDKAAAEKK